MDSLDVARVATGVLKSHVVQDKLRRDASLQSIRQKTSYATVQKFINGTIH